MGRLSFKNRHVGTYCGERFWSVRSWRWWLTRYGLLRRLPNGFSIGPVLFWKEDIRG